MRVGDEAMSFPGLDLAKKQMLSFLAGERSHMELPVTKMWGEGTDFADYKSISDGHNPSCEWE